MNVTFNTANYNSRPSLNSRSNNNINCCKPKPSFAGKAKIAQESSLFSGLSRQYDKLSEGIAKHFTVKLVDSKSMNYLADKFKDSKNLYQHCLTVGSAITSGLYMYKTVTNKNLDKDRKNTLAVNQGLTFIVSTIGAYALDGFINPWWENVTAKFIGNQLQDDKFHANFIEANKKIAENNKKLKLSGNKLDMKPAKKALDALFDSKLYKGMLEQEQSALNTKVKGMGALKSMVVFGLVYRYIVPVAVTKPANKLCEMYLEHKKSKTAGQSQKA